MSRILFSILLASLFLPLVARAQTPPVAAVHPKVLVEHGHERIDPYYWMNQRDNPEVMAWLKAENAYARAVMAPTDPLQKEIYDEIIGRLDPDDASVPYLLDGYLYYTRFTPGGDYPLYCRRANIPDSPEEILLDGNAMGAGQSYFAISQTAVSSDREMLAWGADTVGRRKYSIHFKDLQTGDVLSETIDNVTGRMVWAEGSRFLFYTRQDPQTLRHYQVWRHEVGTDQPDELVFQENDDTYSVSISKSKSRDYLLIESEQTMATEVRFLPADDPEGEWIVFEPRQRGHEYHVDHVDGRFLIRTNRDAPNFRLMEAKEPGKWTEVVAHRPDTLLEHVDGFDDFVVLRERRGGLQHLVVMPEGAPSYEIDFPDPTYAIFSGQNPESSTGTFRYIYSSMTTPTSTFDFDVRTREQKLRKRDRVIGGFDPADYESQFLWATAQDGVQVPISIVYRKDQLDRGRNPLLLYAYGSYGSSSRATFSADRLSLLDRGFVWATAHIRGGQEMGRQWYEDGKLLNKMNTFTDFIDCGRYLASEEWCDADRIYGYGGSAGGLLIGAAINIAPELFDGAIARVPFVDVVTTMLDESIPLTSSEWDEWGDPRKKLYYDYMLSYSPYDQVKAQDYPALLVTAGLHDSQVQYFEPAKWVARLRSLKTDNNPLLLYTNMEAGHGGASGRLSRQKERSLLWAFVIHLARGHESSRP